MSDIEKTERDVEERDGQNARGETNEAQKTTYTADEVRALLQSEGDRRVSGAKKRWERELRDRIGEEAKAIAEEMNAELSERITELESSLTESRQQQKKRERELAISAALAEASLPMELLPLICSVENGSEDSVIDAIGKTVDKKAREMCEKRLTSKAPAAGEICRTLSPEEIRTLPVARLAELMKNN